MKKFFIALITMIVVFIIGCSNDADNELNQETKENESDNNSVEKIDVIVSVDPIVDNGKLTVKGETNIPDGGELMIGLVNEDEDYQASSKAMIKDGEFESETYTMSGNALPAGEYNISVTLSIPSTQEANFTEKTGDEYEKLSGDLMEKSDLGKTMKYEEIVIIN